MYIKTFTYIFGFLFKKVTGNWKRKRRRYIKRTANTGAGVKYYRRKSPRNNSSSMQVKLIKRLSR